jgi:hypothetical protein
MYAYYRETSAENVALIWRITAQILCKIAPVIHYLVSLKTRSAYRLFLVQVFKKNFMKSMNIAMYFLNFD